MLGPARPDQTRIQTRSPREARTKKNLLFFYFYFLVKVGRWKHLTREVLYENAMNRRTMGEASAARVCVFVCWEVCKPVGADGVSNSFTTSPESRPLVKAIYRNYGGPFRARGGDGLVVTGIQSVIGPN